MVNEWWLSSTAHAHTLERQCPGEFIPRPLNLRSDLCACSVVVEERQRRPRVDEMLIGHAWMVYVVA